MTTKVTVDAHAGWPVDVTTIDSYEGQTSRETLRVPPGEKLDFYVTSSRDLLVHEVQSSEAATPSHEVSGDFGYALAALKRGLKVARRGWNGVGLWLELQQPDVHSKMTLPYIYLSYPDTAKTTPRARVPWLASQTDMLADDWHVVT